MALLSSLMLLVDVGNTVTYSCAANCKSCWSSLATNCMSCNTGYVLNNFQCVSSSGANNGCATGYTLDTNDNLCKRTITDTQSPCPPSTYNANTGASTSASCSVCTPGKLEHLKKAASSEKIIIISHLSNFEPNLIRFFTKI